MRPVQLRVLHIAEIAATFDQIALVELDPSPNSNHLMSFHPLENFERMNFI
jgi:hypothetical protein